MRALFSSQQRYISDKTSPETRSSSELWVRAAPAQLSDNSPLPSAGSFPAPLLTRPARTSLPGPGRADRDPPAPQPAEGDATGARRETGPAPKRGRLTEAPAEERPAAPARDGAL